VGRRGKRAVGCRQRAGFGLSSAPEEATRQTLTTLGEYLVGGEGLDLASQLPQGLAENLRREPPNRPMIYSFPDFIQEIGEREGVNIDEALAHARVVVSVLQEAVSEGEMDDVRRQFPSEFDPLFD
jgi:uncharacterized protein (DUF2267 family)